MPNNLASIMPKILAQGLLALRGACVMPSVVNFDYGEDAREKGETVNVPIPSAIDAVEVTPSNVPPATADIAPTTAPIPLDYWWEAPFYLTDKDIAEAINDVMPMQASEAIKAIARKVNEQIFSNYIAIGGSFGTPGTTPFATDTSDATGSRKILNIQLAGMMDRRFVLDVEAEANALNLRAFQDYSWSNALDVIRAGTIGEQRLGFDWFMDQQVPLHTSGDRSGATVSGAQAKGSKTLVVTGGTGSINPGDVFTIAGSTLQYAVVSDAANTWTISPGLYNAVSGGEAITFFGAGASNSPQNLAIHRDCIGFASRPLVDEAEGLGNMIMSAGDPVSGLTLRLEVSREHKRTRWSYDLLWGSKVVRGELGCRLWG